MSQRSMCLPFYPQKQCSPGENKHKQSSLLPCRNYVNELCSFYNFASGELEKHGEGRYVLSLNKEFSEAGQLDLIEKVIYVKNRSGIVQEYIRFSQIFDEQMAKLKTDQDRTKAIQEVFRICEKEKILTEYLQQHRGEVKSRKAFDRRL